jgi:membrane-associated phospholipid phosphatase
MFSQHYFTRKIAHVSLTVLYCCAGFFVLAQNSTLSQKSSKGAGEWKTFVVKDVKELNIPAPPGKEQTQKELKELKEKMSQRNDQVVQQIQYWDAGAPAYRWNQLGYNLISFENENFSIDLFLTVPSAWMNMAIYDATVAAWKSKYNYKRKRPFELDPSVKTVINAPATPSYPCEHTVTAAAAATVLAYFYPKIADSILQLAKQAAESRIYAGVQFPSDVAAAWKLGEDVAARVIAEAKKDGSDKKWTGTMNTDPKLWRGEYPVGIITATAKPILLKSVDQFRPPAPPDFEKDMQDMKNFKQDFRSTNLAYYWASRTGLDLWTELANQKIFEYHLDNNAPACALIYALLGVATHDVSIAIMDAKYAYWGVRPIQYDTTYHPLVPTPPFPGYPSGHATGSSTASSILQYFFPADAPLFKKLAQECADSRFYAGIHFKTDNEVGLEMGKKVGEYIIDSWEKK